MRCARHRQPTLVDTNAPSILAPSLLLKAQTPSLAPSFAIPRPVHFGRAVKHQPSVSSSSAIAKLRAARAATSPVSVVGPSLSMLALLLQQVERTLPEYRATVWRGSAV